MTPGEIMEVDIYLRSPLSDRVKHAQPRSCHQITLDTKIISICLLVHPSVLWEPYLFFMASIRNHDAEWTVLDVYWGRSRPGTFLPAGPMLQIFKIGDMPSLCAFKVQAAS
jgi:hypothetical protein